MTTTAHNTSTTTADPGTRHPATSDISDGDLFEACRHGDESAWNDLVHRYNDRLVGIARYRGNDHASAQDVVQAVWCDLFLSADSVQDADAVGGWLSTATRRHGNRVSRVERRLVPLAAPEVRPAAGAPVDEHVLASERIKAVKRAFAQLPASDQRLLGLLFDDEQHCYADIADELGLPIGSIGPTRARALGRLETLLQLDPLFQQ